MKTKDAPKAEDMMNSAMHTVEPDMPLGDIVAFLLQHSLSNVPVIRREGNQRVLLGFLSEADCLEHLSNELFYGNPSPALTAETIMKRHPVCVSPTTDIFALTSIFISHNHRHLPVVQDQYLLGVVNRQEVLKSLDRYYRQWTKTRDRERFPVDVHQIMNHRFLVTH